MSQKISVRLGFLVGLELEEGDIILRILTGVRSCETGEWEDEIIRIPYTGPCEKKDLDQLINLHRVRIIIEPDEDDKEERNDTN